MRLLFLLLALLFTLSPLDAQRPPNDSTTKARAFVDAFYAWYVPIAAADSREAPFVTVLRKRRELLTPLLFAALKADNDAQTKAPHDLVGLDADPFLNSQDPCAGYAIGVAMHLARAYLIQVYAVCEGTRAAEPSAVVSVQSDGKRWQIADVFLGNGRDGLMHRLRALAEERKRR